MRAWACAAALTLLLAGCAVVPRVPAVAVIAHRGEHLQHPENTLPAVQAAIDAGADFVELDIQTTADGQLVLMHGHSVDRTTNGAGEIRAMTLEQVRALDAGIRFSPAFAGTRVPTFDEALALARGRIGIYVDVKDASAEALLAAFDRHDMARRVVVYGAVPLLQQIAQLRPDVRVMPEALDPEHLEQCTRLLPLHVAAFGEKDFDEATVRVARQARLNVFVDRLGAQDTPEDWGAALARGATGIQTDHPRELIEFLRARGAR